MKEPPLSAILRGVNDLERSKRSYMEGLGWKVQDFKGIRVARHRPRDPRQLVISFDQVRLNRVEEGHLERFAPGGDGTACRGCVRSGGSRTVSTEWPRKPWRLLADQVEEGMDPGAGKPRGRLQTQQ